MFVESLCLIASAKVFPIPVKKVLESSVDIDCEFVVSTPLDTIHEGAVECVLREVKSLRVFHRPEGLFLFSLIKDL